MVTLKRSEKPPWENCSFPEWFWTVNLLADVEIPSFTDGNPLMPLQVLIVIAAVIYLQDSSKKESSNTEERPNLIFVF